MFKDHWQGEFSVALFGACGWAIIAFLAGVSGGDYVYFKLPQFAVINEQAPALFWELWLFVFGVVSIVGLRYSIAALRLVGALGIFVALLDIFVGVAEVGPWSFGMGMYLACISIEFFVIIYQTSTVIRYWEHTKWTWVVRQPSSQK